jgi:hypothetical protein
VHPPGGAIAGLLEDESMVSISQIEGQLRASSIRRISDLADKHPDETLSILRGWMAQETAEMAKSDDQFASAARSGRRS